MTTYRIAVLEAEVIVLDVQLHVRQDQLKQQRHSQHRVDFDHTNSKWLGARDRQDENDVILSENNGHVRNAYWSGSSRVSAGSKSGERPVPEAEPASFPRSVGHVETAKLWRVYAVEP